MKDKIKKILDFIRSFDSIAVAFSGGVDSATLAALCVNEVNKVVAITVVSEITPSRELKSAKKIANEIGIKHKTINLSLLENPNFVKNTKDRCFYCKKLTLKTILDLYGRDYSAIFEGTNADELKEHRPGYRAVVSFDKVYSPWAKFGFTKVEIRNIAEKMGLSFFNKPPLACLATRIPFGIEIDLKKLEMIDKAENFILGFMDIEQVRVRFFNKIAVIEVEKKDIPKFLNADKLLKRLREIGFRGVFLDLEGYKSGKLVDLSS